jgi:hypothetical protein
MAEIARSKMSFRRKYCAGPDKFVEIGARVVDEGGKTKVIKWESCDAKNWCGKKCNLFFDQGEYDFMAFSQTEKEEL